MAVAWIAFHITDRCQLDCDHCLRDPGQKPVDLDVAVFERILDEAVSVYRTGEVALTGGEPTLHPRFFEIIDRIVDRGLRWHMVSNAEGFDRVLSRLAERPDRLTALTRIGFSLDGAREETHDAIRGQGSYRTVMAAIARATQSGVRFHLQMAVNRRNIDEIEDFALVGAQLGATQISFELTQPTGTILDGSLFVSSAEARRAADRIERLDATLRIPVVASDGFPKPLGLHLCDAFRSDVLHIDAHGNMNLCCRHAGIPTPEDAEDHIGSVADSSLVSAHERMLGVVDIAVRSRLRALAEGSLDDWDESPCNFCLRRFGKPHWTESGAGGTAARRQRWSGARDIAARSGARPSAERPRTRDRRATGD